jgi:RNA polymerase sigma-70 factor (ECF subfamily)
MSKLYSEDMLVKQCQKQSPKGQKVVYERFSPKMLAICLRYVPEELEAEDLMIGGFLKIFQKIDQFKSEGSFEGWIRRIMVNECLNYLRKRRWLYAHSDIEDVKDALEFNQYEQEAQADELLAFVQTLPQGYRTVFNLYAIEGFSHKEIAEKLNITESTSKSQLSRARALLQKMVENHQQKLNKIKHG